MLVKTPVDRRGGGVLDALSAAIVDDVPSVVDTLAFGVRVAVLFEIRTFGVRFMTFDARDFHDCVMLCAESAMDSSRINAGIGELGFTPACSA
jgi:hypothetical protein